MKPGAAILYAEVPDATRYLEFLFSPFQDFNTEHINHFSRESLTNLLVACGFRGRAPVNGWWPPRPRCRIRPSTWWASPRNPRPQPIWPGLSPRMGVSAGDRGLHRGLLEPDRGDRSSASRSAQGLGTDPRLGCRPAALKMLAQTSLADAEIEAFVDGNPIHHGKTIRGIPVLPRRADPWPPSPDPDHDDPAREGDRGQSRRDGADQSRDHPGGCAIHRDADMSRPALPS